MKSIAFVDEGMSNREYTTWLQRPLETDKILLYGRAWGNLLRFVEDRERERERESARESE